ncbi:uncharacterized protein LOC125470892 [Pyrus x bretschneideri]|uniref:uncharacterized protein LOC125470892 n=1 Tax=Pyrus x bretschneideri TaxID=225117 RepID=UPI002030BACF|nr:uncharacterized protein LOC125470892 [Pyrus x bretschneideri]
MTDFADLNIMERFFKRISASPSLVIEKNNDTQGQDSIAFILSNLPSDLELVFLGNDESEHSSNHGNFLELLQFLADHSEDVKAITLKNALENHKLTSPDIQKDIVNACATETIKAIIKDIGTSLFSILIDESRDASTKEQMATIETIDEVFSRFTLSMSRLCGQGYMGPTICKLALVAVAKNIQIESLFSIVTILVNVVGASSKCCDLLQEKQSTAVIEALNNGEFTSGKLMKDILGITNELSQALQRKDQDIINAMKLVGVCKQRLEIMRKSGWDSLLCEVSEFFLKHDIDVPNMDDMFLSRS